MYNDDFSLGKFKEGVANRENNWKADLQHLLPDDPPTFKDVSAEVLKKISEIMKK